MSPAPTHSGTTFLEFSRSLVFDDEAKAAYEADPEGTLAEAGFDAFTIEEVRIAMEHVADALPAPVASRIDLGDEDTDLGITDYLGGMAAIDPIEAQADWDLESLTLAEQAQATLGPELDHDSLTDLSLQFGESDIQDYMDIPGVTSVDIDDGDPVADPGPDIDDGDAEVDIPGEPPEQRGDDLPDEIRLVEVEGDEEVPAAAGDTEAGLNEDQEQDVVDDELLSAFEFGEGGDEIVDTPVEAPEVPDMTAEVTEEPLDLGELDVEPTTDEALEVPGFAALDPADALDEPADDGDDDLTD